ncbi:MAG: hypothetical protein NC428_07605 [Clostridium sp.]|nr:hypothetical protein [Clostridium sp.]
MTTLDIMNFSEEKFVFVKSILKTEGIMSRVALMRFLIKYKKTFILDPDCPFKDDPKEIKEEIRQMIDEINDFLARIDDEDYKRLFIDD